MTCLNTFARIGVLCVLGSTLGLSQIPLAPNPSRVVGHALLRQQTVRPNLAVGRELNTPQGVAIDRVNRIIYVADTGNNRVLAWRNLAGFESGAMADFVVGQRSFFDTEALGPGTTLTSGLNAPVAVAVDPQGNLFVVDAGNNRVMKYRRPYELPADEVKTAELVVGQPSLNSRAANFSGVNRRGLALQTNAGVLRGGIAFDGEGNLFLSDSGNNRVLRYPAGSIGDGAANGPEADLVLGQPDFGTNAGLSISANANTRTNKRAIRNPSGLALDQGGRLYVCDALGRVLVWASPLASSIDAVRIMGITTAPPAGQPALPPINEQSLGVILAANRIAPPEGVFLIGNVPFVIDSAVHRIQRYDPFDQWPAETTQFSPSARATIGQDSAQQSEIRPNRGRAEPSAATYNFPVAAAFADGVTLIVDSQNHRLLAARDLSSGPALAVGEPYSAVRVLGQVGFEFDSANLIEGREFNFSQIGGLVLDRSSDPPRLYVADSANNRILAFRDARRVRPGDFADLVIGQPDGFRSLINYPSNLSTSPNPSGLFLPSGLAIDAEGNLWVADTGNSRILRFPRPFDQPSGELQSADLVLGQRDFTSRLTDVTPRNMSAPWGLAFSSNGALFASDASQHRVLMFSPPFESGMAAQLAFGQPDLNSGQAGTADNRFNGPRGLAFDTDDRLYVADTGNNRVSIFSRAPAAGPDPPSAFRLTRSGGRPNAVAVSAATSEIWVAWGVPATSVSTNNVQRFRRFEELAAVGIAPTLQFNASLPLGLALDGFGNLYLADAINRVAIHFPLMNVVSAANYLPRVSPGSWTTLQTLSNTYSFGAATDIAPTVPLPGVLGDLSVQVNDRPAPMYFVSPAQINFMMPAGLSTSDNVEIQVVQDSTGRVMASQLIRLTAVAPALFTSTGSGTGQVAALNQDNSVNSSDNAIPRGQVITLFGTGGGVVDGQPPDGSPATGASSTRSRPRVAIGGRFVDDADILYSGLAPGLIGVWQINVKVPESTGPGSQLVLVLLEDVPNNDPSNPTRIRTTIFVR